MTPAREGPIPALLVNGWLQYALALSYIPIFALDWAGLWVSGSALLVLLTLLCVLPLQAALVVGCWKRSRWRCTAPLLALVLSVSLGHRVGRQFGDRLIRYRFDTARSEYEAVADQLLRSAYPSELKREHEHLGYRAGVITSGPSDAVVGVSFLVVSHGFAGHLGFVRLTDPTTAKKLLKSPPPGWTDWLEQLDDAWYLVAEN